MNCNMTSALPVSVSAGITVREVCGLLKGYKKLWLIVDGGAVEFDPVPALSMEAYGDFVVSGVFLHDAGKGFDDAEFELVIAHAPLRRG